MDVEGDVAVLIGDVVCTDEVLVIEVVLQHGAVQRVDLVYDFRFHLLDSCLVVYHLGEDVQLWFGQFRFRGLNGEELSESKSGDDVGQPLQVAHLHAQILGKVGWIELSLREDDSRLVVGAVADAIVEPGADGDVSHGNISLEPLKVRFSLMVVIIVSLSKQTGYFEIGLQIGVGIVGINWGHFCVELGEEVVESVSLAQTGVGHVESALRLSADVGEGEGEEREEEYKDFHSIVNLLINYKHY